MENSALNIISPRIRGPCARVGLLGTQRDSSVTSPAVTPGPELCVFNKLLIGRPEHGAERPAGHQRGGLLWAAASRDGSGHTRTGAGRPTAWPGARPRRGGGSLPTA